MFSMIQYSLPLNVVTSVPFGPGRFITIQYGVKGIHVRLIFIPWKLYGYISDNIHTHNNCFWIFFKTQIRFIELGWEDNVRIEIKTKRKTTKIVFVVVMYIVMITELMIWFLTYCTFQGTTFCHADTVKRGQISDLPVVLHEIRWAHMACAHISGSCRKITFTVFLPLQCSVSLYNFSINFSKLSCYWCYWYKMYV